MNAIVVFGDVIRSRRNASGSTTWLRTLSAELEAATPPESLLAPFEFTQGDELQGLLASDADPLDAVLRASFNPDRSPMRWVIVAGEVDPGTGPATQRTAGALRHWAGRCGSRRSHRAPEHGARDPGMTADPILTLAWLILAHLVADFLLQTSGGVAAKTAGGGRALSGFAIHGLGVAICLVPVALAFGGPGVMVLVAILVRPLEVGDELIGHGADGTTDVAAAHGPGGAGESRGAGTSAGPGAGRGWSIRIGPLTGRVVADPAPAAGLRDDAQIRGERV